MSESEEDIQIIDESQQEAVAAASSVEPFEANAYMKKIVDLLRSTDKDSSERLKYLVAQTWARPADSANFYSESYSMDSGGVSKLPLNSMSVKNRIAGTQRLMYAPSPIMKKSNSELDKAGVSSLIKKPKKLMPVIDDSIYCTTDQPCKTCGGVSLAGNQVLACKRCRDCFHMRCSVPPVPVEEASDPKFQYYCKVCLISRKVKMDSSRSRSPSPAVLDVKKKILKR